MARSYDVCYVDDFDVHLIGFEYVCYVVDFDVHLVGFEIS